MEEVIAAYEATSGRYRARVFRVSNAAYRVDVERLIDAVDAGGEKRGEFWSPIRDFTSYTDDLDRAAALAQENLRCAQAI